ncbi:MAG: DUF1810 domain-containing protein [Rhodoferax sp.]
MRAVELGFTFILGNQCRHELFLLKTPAYQTAIGAASQKNALFESSQGSRSLQLPGSNENAHGTPIRRCDHGLGLVVYSPFTTEPYQQHNDDTTDMNDPHNLQRFVDAQDPVYDEILAELAAGRKASHWMWFAFPQLAGLGRSDMAQRFAMVSRQEAMAFWQHPLLAARLRKCIELVLAIKGKTAFQIFGTPDDLKFWSCLTLFATLLPDQPLFKVALQKYFEGRADPKTLELLRWL